MVLFFFSLLLSRERTRVGEVEKSTGDEDGISGLIDGSSVNVVEGAREGYPPESGQNHPHPYHVRAHTCTNQGVNLQPHSLCCQFSLRLYT
eukprot:scaffold6672_cov286-Pinguiococcus_pyrenoidosus.AAC.5